MILRNMKTATITKKGQISIPQDMRGKKGFKVGDKIILLSFDNKIELRPIKEVEEKLYPALATQDVLKKDWLTQEEDKAWKDL